MAKRGTSTRLVEESAGRPVATRKLLVDAAVETLKADGFAGASSRVIAGRAGCNQALVFYHFGSVVGLLLAALDSVSASRLEHYSAAVEHARSPVELVDVAAAIFRADLEAGYVRVLVEMIAGASSTPGLAAEIAARLSPWRQFAVRAIQSVLDGSSLRPVVPSGDLAHGVVALYLGLELLSHLDGDREPALRLFDHAKRLAFFAEALGAGAPGAIPSAPT